MILPGEHTYSAIAIGTSAGGFLAVSTILQGLPQDYPLPVFIVQHRSKHSGDLFEELLQGKCRITVKQADEKEQIRQGVAYVAPPDYHLLIEDDHTLSLTSEELVCFSRPSIDVLFESAANVYSDQLVGIVLTGASHDGAAGIRAISHSRGLTIAQNPEEALFPAMPLAAIQTQQVKHIYTLAEIQTFLMNINSHEHETKR